MNNDTRGIPHLIDNSLNTDVYEIGDLQVAVRPIESQPAFAMKFKAIGKIVLVVDSKLPAAERDKIVNDFVANGNSFPSQRWN